MRIKHTIAAITLGATLTGATVTAAAVLPSVVGAAEQPAGGEGASSADAAGHRLDDALAPLVADGTLTQAQADAVAATLRQDATERRQHRDERRSELVAAAAAFFGITPEDLQARWQAGDSLAAIAQDTGHTRQELVDALVAAIGGRAEQAAAAGTITAEQAQRIEDKAPSLVERLVDAPGGSLRQRVAERIAERRGD